MDVGTVLSAAQTLFAALQFFELKEIPSMFRYESELKDLQRTVLTINAVFRDAETKQELTHEAQHLIEELKDAVFDADDLFDEFVTLAEQKQLVEEGRKLTKRVSDFFSPSRNQLSIAYRMSRGVKEIKKKLDDIATDTQKFGFKIDSEPIRKRRMETCSYVNEVDIIGREDDLERIVGMLLASNLQCGVSCLTIVGIGGLGKTALAQLVYNDSRIKSAFSLRLWACVADQDQHELDVKEILGKILASASIEKNDDQSTTLDQVQSKLQKQLKGNKFLLVLDDVWTENRNQWGELVKYLLGGEMGSWIVVTTRSQGTARIIDYQTYPLEGLSGNNSWHLFKRTAFTTDQLSNSPGELVEIGRMIVDGCVGSPLAIRVAGSLLFGQHKSKWLSVQKFGLANMEQGKTEIMPILKLSFHHLKTLLKSCFSYCALFPKDFVMKKEILIRLWIAQGYIIPFDEGQSIEDTAEEYFSILLRRCFFQDIKKDEFGEIISCKIHDLMHDVAQSVAGKEIYAMDAICNNLDKKIRHLSIIDGGRIGKYFLGKTYIRSHLFANDAFWRRADPFPVEALVENCRCLRALDLSNLSIKSLPDSIGKLLHLRFLDLSLNKELEVLPNSITKLYNLQTLILSSCFSLKELPKNLSRLVKLRVLKIDKCDDLRYMPRGMNSLERLVGYYMVGGDKKSSRSRLEQWFDGLEDLKPLDNLKGHLNIKFRWIENVKSVVKKDYRKGGLYLSSKEHLNSLDLFFREDVEIEDADEIGMIMSLMEELRPHSNLKKLGVNGYCGVRMPGWLTLLPNLVNLFLYNCEELEYAPCLGNLPHLKSLNLSELRKLEYIEESGSTAEKGSFYPSLEQLELDELPKLKGWRRGEEDKSSSSSNPQLQQLIVLLPCLSRLQIKRCKELVNILVCPNVEVLNLLYFNEKLEIIMKTSSTTLREVGPSSSSILSTASTSSTSYSEIGNLENWASSSSSCDNVVPKLKKVEITNVAWLNSLPMEALCCLETLKIEWDNDMEDLPNWMQYCASLHTLEIYVCHGLKRMPNWMPKVTSLKKLIIEVYSERLKRRCQKDPPGEDWLYIQHIPDILIEDILLDFSDTSD